MTAVCVERCHAPRNRPRGLMGVVKSREIKGRKARRESASGRCVGGGHRDEPFRAARW